MLVQFIATTLIVGAALIAIVVCWLALQNKLDCNVYPDDANTQASEWAAKMGEEPEDWS